MNFPNTTAVQHKLSNGLDVILHEDHAHPVVSLQIWVETGSMHELPNPGAGLSHLLEHMVFKGTRSFSGEVLANRVEELGGSWNAYTTYDRTVYYLDGPAKAAKELLQMLFELVYLPNLPEEDFEMEREVIRREIAMGKDDPHSVGWEVLMETGYAVDTRRFPIIGHLDRFNAITHEEMVTYHEGRYTFDNSFVVISGDVNPEELYSSLEVYVKEVPTRRLRELSLPEEGNLPAPITATREFPIPMCKTTIFWYTPPMGHPDMIALETLASVIGGARSSCLYQSLREEKGLALSVSTWCWHPRDGNGIFAVSAETLPENHEQLLAEVIQELEQLDFSGMERALMRAKKQTTVSQYSTLTTASGRAKDLGSNWFETRNLDFTKYYLEQIKDITVEDLKRVADQYLIGKPSVTFSLVPEGYSSPKVEQSSSAKGEIIPELTTLKNGIPLIKGKDHKLPLVTFTMTYKGGSSVETAETEGIGMLHSVLLSKGTRKRSAEEFVTTLDEVGASLSFSGGNNTFIVSGACLVEDLETLLMLTTEALMEPLFDEAQLEKERALLLSKVKENAQDPLRLAFWHARRELFQDSPYRLSRLGSEESVGAFQKQDLLNYHHSLIEQGECSLAVYGDLTDEAFNIVKRSFGKLPYAKKEHSLPTPNFGEGRKDISLDKEQAVVTVSYPGASLNSDDCAALEVIQDYLSSMAGPLFTELREKLGLAYYVSCSQFYGVNTGMFNFYMGTDPARKEEALEELQKLVSKIVEEGISEAELERVKTGLDAQNAKSDQSHSAQARAHGINVLFGRGIEHKAAEREKIIQLTQKNIADCLKKYFSDVTPVITVVAPT